MKLLAEPIGTEMWIIIAVIGLAALVALYYFLNRWVFAMKRQLWNQKSQINLLIKIAHKLGVPPTDTELIEAKNNNANDALL